jgi:hypothetical protein
VQIRWSSHKVKSVAPLITSAVKSSIPWPISPRNPPFNANSASLMTRHPLRKMTKYKAGPEWTQFEEIPEADVRVILLPHRMFPKRLNTKSRAACCDGCLHLYRTRASGVRKQEGLADQRWVE